jgi:PAS domain S-box-containing protein/diguanylate cyclase (GGDEF)-like protein
VDEAVDRAFPAEGVPVLTRLPDIDTDRETVLDLIDRDSLGVLFQPLVRIATGRPVGVEALCRGPLDSPLQRPDELFSAARFHGLTSELDWASRLGALRQALSDGAAADMTLFLNAEPEALLGGQPAEFAALRQALEDLGTHVVLEVTERDLCDQLGDLLTAVEEVRSWGWSIAVDDVGADPASLALLPFLRPEVLKLDLRLVQEHPSPEVAQIVNAVLAHSERTGAHILAEGIETLEHERLATAMGATIGQGWLYGAAGPLPQGEWDRLRMPHVERLKVPGTPWERVHGLPSRRATKPLLVAMSKTLERQALANGEFAVLLSSFQHARHLSESTAQRYSTLAGVLSFVVVLGEGVPPAPAEGVRGSELHPDDPLVGEWVLSVVGPHFAAALVAQDLGDAGPDSARRFDYCLTYDRATALTISAALLRRVHPTQRGPMTRRTLTTRRRPVGTPPAELFELAVQASPTGVTIAAADGDQSLLYVNPAFERMTGYSAEDVIGRNCRVLQGPGTDPLAVDALRRAARTGEPVRSRLLNYRADGTTFWNQVDLCPVLGADGEPTHFIGIQTDVSREVEAESRLLRLATHDDLTGLHNRRAVLLLLEEELMRSSLYGTATLLVLVRLTGVGALQARRGHAVVDRLLQESALRLSAARFPGEALAHLGEGRFALVAPGLRPDPGVVAATGQDTVTRLLETVRAPFVLDGQRLVVGARAARAAYPADATTVETLMDVAERQLYESSAAPPRDG